MRKGWESGVGSRKSEVGRQKIEDRKLKTVVGNRDWKNDDDLDEIEMIDQNRKY